MPLPMNNGPAWLGIAKGILLLLLLARATYTDLKKKEIEYWVSAVIGAIGVLAVIFGYGPAWHDAALAAAISFGIFTLLALIGGGGGDVLLATAVAIWFGLKLSFISMGVSGLAGIVMGLIWRKKKHEKEIPFAPCIQFGALTAMVYCFLIS